MSGIKKLAGQTLWYGVPTIAARFFGYALNILLFWLYKPLNTSFITQVYAVIPFLNIVFTYGLETSYFRYAINKDRKELYNTLNVSIIISTLFLSVLLFWQSDAIAGLVKMNEHPEYYRWMVWILLFDTLSVLPFAKLRQEGRPRKYAFTKATGIFVQVLFTVFFLGICPNQYAKDPGTWWLSWYDPSIDIGYFIIANIIGSVVTFLLLWKELKDFRFRFNAALWKEVMIYSYPLIIVGFGGMINEMMSRVLYASITKLPRQEALHNLGVFGANYKLAVLITIFIQVFRMGAEPFFFNKSTDADAPRTYARITKFFVIVCCFMWLGISLYLDIWGRLAFGHNKEYTEGIMVVPILAMGSLFLGVYYNLSVWYKLTNRNMTGAYITIAGAVITILLNILWIPLWDYFGSAWATFICYAFMMVTSYLLGQKHYRIPYPWKKLLAYITICVLIFFIHQLFLKLGLNVWINRAMATALLLAFALFILKIEKQEFQRLPFIGKYI